MMGPKHAQEIARFYHIYVEIDLCKIIFWQTQGVHRSTLQ